MANVLSEETSSTAIEEDEGSATEVSDTCAWGVDALAVNGVQHEVWLLAALRAWGLVLAAL